MNIHISFWQLITYLCILFNFRIISNNEFMRHWLGNPSNHFLYFSDEETESNRSRATSG